VPSTSVGLQIAKALQYPLRMAMRQQYHSRKKEKHLPKTTAETVHANTNLQMEWIEVHV